MENERIKREAKAMVDTLMDRGRKGKPYCPEDLASGLAEAFEDVVIERRLASMETPSQTKLRHRVEARVKRDMKEKESAKRGVVGNWIPDLPNGEVLDAMARLYAAKRKEQEEFLRQRKETTRQMRDDYYRQTTESARLRDEKLIQQSRARRKQAEKEARVRRGYPKR